MDLSDALPEGNKNQQSSGAMWPGQPPNNPMWPGGPQQPSGMWPGGPSPNHAPSFPGGPQPGGPIPSWPGGGAQPGPSWPSPPSSGPSQPPASFPGGPSPPSGPIPSWPGGGAQPGPSWPLPPSGGPSQPSPSPGFAPQQNLTVPFRQDFPRGLQDRNLITICGTVKPNPNKFTIDFCTASDLVFHFNPRFNEGGNKVIVRNSEIGKRWGQEERDLPNLRNPRDFPFTAGKHFEIKIEVTNSCFRVTVDGSHLFDFKHRMHHLGAINRMNIYYDVTLSKVTFY